MAGVEAHDGDGARRAYDQSIVEDAGGACFGRSGWSTLVRRATYREDGSTSSGRTPSRSGCAAARTAPVTAVPAVSSTRRVLVTAHRESAHHRLVAEIVAELARRSHSAGCGHDAAKTHRV